MEAGIPERAHALLQSLAGSGAAFRPGQLEAITALVEQRERVLLVQRTGWGKSAVYFIATRLLRDAGSGPTLLVSPLLALMRNQVEMARRSGVRAYTVNSSNPDEWDTIRDHLGNDEVDLLLISPERLNNKRFREEMLPAATARSGLLVIDEVHCISDWGHDFRPDYRRLSRVLDLLPANVPVLGTTATANDRVIDDIGDQLGESLVVQRGPLERESLVLDVLRIPDQAARMAWLATYLPELPGTGIVYCLTIPDTRRLCDWLVERGIDAMAYSGGDPADQRAAVESALLDNQVKAVVATSALGMGFDKPDLGFVVHFQAPGSAIAYYQQVGRAGRAVDVAHGILLAGEEDVEIQDHFIDVAFPPRQQAQEVVATLQAEARPMSRDELEARVNIRRQRLESMLKILEVEGAVERADGGWLRTLQPWIYDEDRVQRVTAQRRAEQRAMAEYTTTATCLMQFLRAQLDDPAAAPCRRCARCTGQPMPTAVSDEVVGAAVSSLRARALEISPRKQWPGRAAGRSGRIPVDLQAEPGRALSVFGDAGWGRHVRRGKQEDGRFPDELVAAAAELVGERWPRDHEPTWLTFVPSLRQPVLVRDFAERLAAALALPCRPVVDKARETRPQKLMENTAQQGGNVLDTFAVTGPVDPGPVLLVDDVVDSRWTLTVVAAILREAGSGPVYPLALASARPR